MGISIDNYLVLGYIHTYLRLGLDLGNRSGMRCDVLVPATHDTVIKMGNAVTQYRIELKPNPCVIFFFFFVSFSPFPLTLLVIFPRSHVHMKEPLPMS